MSHKLAYAAGILDGEGSFGIITVKWHWGGFRGPVRRAVIQCGMTTVEPLQLLQELFGGYLNGPYVHKGSLGKKPCWKWSITTLGEAARAIRLLRPYLIVKRRNAALVLRYIHWRQQQHTSRYSRLPRPEFLDVEL